MPVFGLAPQLSSQLLRYSLFLLCFKDNLLADELFKSIEQTIPAFVVTIARFFAGQLLVPKPQFRSAATLEKLDCHDAGPIHPNFVVIPLPCENNFLSGNEFLVFAERAHF